MASKIKHADIAMVLARFGERSAISGKASANMAYARWDKSRPWELNNIVPLTKEEARSHAQRGLSEYPKHFVAYINRCLKGQSLDARTNDADLGTPHPPLIKEGKVDSTESQTELSLWYLTNFGALPPMFLMRKGRKA